MTICTLTLSPALDIEYHARAVTVGLNRTREHQISAGGKGINVSRALLRCAGKDGRRDFNLRTVAPLGGPTGDMLARLLAEEGIPVTAVPIRENTRTNVSLIPDRGTSLEINAPGTPIGDRFPQITEECLRDLGPGDVLVIAGSCPSDVPKSAPAVLVGLAKQRGITAVLDCDGEALGHAVNADIVPDLIKPNREELAALAELPKDADTDDLRRAAESLGIENVITTMAGDGAMLTSRAWDGRTMKTVFFPTEKRPVIRLKGAGDTFLGAFVYAYYVRGGSPEEAMKSAAAAAGSYVSGGESASPR
ncbi:MAG: 1-phosphofructokinase family hexose kinase [Clostridiales bacterium]|nr:1-phosphofructokinase family hexose kinase [Clostridiales bacterium]